MNLYRNRDVLFIKGGRLSSINSSNRKQSLDSTQWIWQWWKWRWRTRWFLYRILHVCSTGIFFSNSVSSNKKYPQTNFIIFTTFIKSSSMMYDFTDFTLDLSSFHTLPFQPQPSKPPQATPGWRHHLSPRLAMASGTSSHRRWNHNLRLAWAKMMYKNGYRKTSDTVIWGLFGEYFGIVGMILGIIWQMLCF